MTPEKLGKYQIERELGRGAMGVVYLAFDPIIQRKVAIKTMNAEAFQDEEQRARFFREARSAGALQHPGIVTIYEMGMDGETPYIAMEYVEGEDLVSAIRRGDLTLEQKLDIMIQMLKALDFAHAKSIIHRDIKPANIRILPDGTVKIMDFGIAKQQDADFTRTGLVVGTLSYMSPEQVQGKPLDPRSDQFSAGVVFYQLLTGKKPFGGDNITNVVYQIISFRAESLEVPGAPTVLTKVVQKMMAPDPEHRFPTCGEAARVLEQELRYLTGEAEAPTALLDREEPPSVPPLPPVPGGPEVAGTESAQGSGRKWVTIVLVLFLVAVAAAVGLKAFQFWKKKQRARLRQVHLTESKEPVPVVQEPVTDREARKGTEPEGGEMSSSQRDQTGETAKQPEDQKPTPEAQVVSKKEPRTHTPATVKTEQRTAGKPAAGTDASRTAKKTPARQQLLPPPVRREPPKPVFVKEGQVRKPIGLIGDLGPTKEEMKKFRSKIQQLPAGHRKNLARRELSAGQQALGQGQRLKAAVHFWRVVELAPREAHGYAWLFSTLVELKAWEQAERVLDRAQKMGVSTGELQQNVRFRQAYDRYMAR